MTTLKIGELVRGCEPGRMQSVGAMQVVPLVSEFHDDRFAPPTEARIGTAGYGNLVVANPADRVLLVPAGAAYMVAQKAQNHALPSAGCVPKQATRTFDTAVCVQQTQGGYIAEGAHELMLLPAALRRAAHAARLDQSFQRLWPAIGEFSAAAGLENIGGHLEKFFERFRAELDQFVAEFEPVPQQVGAVVLVNGTVAGVERTPSADYFRAVWRPLIRECYGSMALVEARKGTPAVPRTRVPLRQAASLGDLADALGEAETEERRRVGVLLDGVRAAKLSVTTDEAGETAIEGLGGDGQPFVGQCVPGGRCCTARSSRPRTGRSGRTGRCLTVAIPAKARTRVPGRCLFGRRGFGVVERLELVRRFSKSSTVEHHSQKVTERVRLPLATNNDRHLSGHSPIPKPLHRPPVPGPSWGWERGAVMFRDAWLRLPKRFRRKCEPVGRSGVHNREGSLLASVSGRNSSAVPANA